MNALVRKEVRLLLPSWIVALLLAVVPAWLTSAKPEPEICALASWLGLVIVTLAPIGRECSLGTFSSLLTQPIPRARIWWTKVIVLALALLVLLAVGCLSFLLRSRGLPSLQAPGFVVGVYGSLALAFLIGGLWTTLLFRQVAAAFWITLLAPMALTLLVFWNLFPKYLENGDVVCTVLIMVFGLYSVAGFGWARHQFLRAQDVAWTGGMISLPKLRGIPKPGISPRLRRKRRPFLALVSKEFQLQQAALLMAAGLFALHLSTIALRKFGGDVTKQSVWEGITFLCWGLWVVIPWLVGSDAVAEERRLGTIEGQLCLPVTRRLQFAIKLGTVLILAVLLGAVLPWVLEVSAHTPSMTDVIRHPILLLIFVTVLFIGIAALSFYASTLAHNTLQALGLALVAVIVATVLFNVAGWPKVIFGRLLWQGSLVFWIGCPIMLAALVWLAHWNYRRVHVGRSVWWRNLIALIGSLALIIVVTTALYHRAWELFTPLEPPHGPARLTGTKPVTMRIHYPLPLSVLLPDGRLWQSRWTYDFRWEQLVNLDQGRFVKGSNWIDVAASFYQTVGIQSDGSLWVSEKPTNLAIWHSDAPNIWKPAKMVRFGGDNDWTHVVLNSGGSALLLKTDGTLWRWWTGRYDSHRQWWPGRDDSHQKWKGLRSVEPHRLGRESNWAEMFSADGKTYLRRNDGQVWAIENSDTRTKKDGFELEPGLVMERCSHLDPIRWRDLTRCSVWHVCVRDDGTLWAWSDDQPGRFFRPCFQIGNQSDWVAVAGARDTLAALKADGTLWKWNPDSWQQYPRFPSPIRLGSHSDWIAVAGAWGAIVSLAADGSLWYWQCAHSCYPFEINGQNCLAPSRKPKRIGNIFDNPD